MIGHGGLLRAFSFARPIRGSESLDKLPDGPARDGIVLMGGDFNLAKVDWEEDRIPAGC